MNVFYDLTVVDNSVVFILLMKALVELQYSNKEMIS